MLGTKVKLLLAVLIVGGAAWFVLRGPPSPAVARGPAPVESGHAVEIDHSMAAALAMQNAPEGRTPCESAYNAFKASYDVSQSQGAKAVVLRLAPRDDFLAKCAALPPPVQACLVPRYLTLHRSECDRVRPSRDTLSPMVDLLQRTEPTGTTEENVTIPAAPSAGPAAAP